MSTDDHSDVHTFETSLSWYGSTATRDYDRSHSVTATPSEQTLELSSAPAYRGDPERLNPEQLVVAAASSCQLLSFLAVASRARVDVVGYTDDATAVMPTDNKPIWITRIDLRPRITVRGDVSDERLEQLVELGHQSCFISNSLRTEVMVSPTFVRAG